MYNPCLRKCMTQPEDAASSAPSPVLPSFYARPLPVCICYHPCTPPPVLSVEGGPSIFFFVPHSSQWGLCPCPCLSEPPQKPDPALLITQSAKGPYNTCITILLEQEPGRGLSIGMHACWKLHPRPLPTVRGKPAVRRAMWQLGSGAAGCGQLLCVPGCRCPRDAAKHSAVQQGTSHQQVAAMDAACSRGRRGSRQ